jgi:Ser/Thr protein kinase RdoA (MazF antagonist)
VNFAKLTTEDQVASLLPLAQEIIDGYDLGECQIESINHEYNSTFKVTTANGEKYALRINVNSGRTLEQLRAEIFFVEHLLANSNLKLPSPVVNRQGSPISSAFHVLLNQELHAVLFSWLEGEEPGDEPTLEQARATGVLMAKMHQATVGVSLPKEASLHTATDPLWKTEDLISKSEFADANSQVLIVKALQRIQDVQTQLFETNQPQLIHADVHPWNLMWNAGELAVFDFDDCVIGLPAQDVAVTVYYFDEQEHIDEFLAGYTSVQPLPEVTEDQAEVLKLQRRLYLLNYLHETSNPEHTEMIPKYLAETCRRIGVYFEQYTDLENPQE